MGLNSKKLLVVIPMKDLQNAKSRLGDFLNSKERKLLAKLLFLRTLSILDSLRKKNGFFFDLAVVTKSLVIRDLSLEYDSFHIEEDQEGLNQALDTSYKWAFRKKYKFFSVLPADLADPNPTELLSFLNHHKTSKKPFISICPSNDLGTNALMVSIPTQLTFSFGDKSFVKHSNIAKKLGILPKILPYPSLRHDVDTREDLQKIKIVK